LLPLNFAVGLLRSFMGVNLKILAGAIAFITG